MANWIKHVPCPPHPPQIFWTTLEHSYLVIAQIPFQTNNKGIRKLEQIASINEGSILSIN